MPSSPRESSPPAASSGPRPELALAVVDYQPHTRGGHFGPWLKWFVRELAARFDRVAVFTPSAAQTANLLGFDGTARGNVACHALPPGPRKAFYRLKRNRCPLVKIMARARREAPDAQWHAFVMWGDDLLIHQVAEGESGAAFATLGGNSWTRRGRTGRAARREDELARLCDAHPDCAALLVPDQFMITAEDRKTLWIPGYENVELPADGAISPTVDTIRQHIAGALSVGSFGMLGGGRAVNAMLRLALLHPSVRFVLAGKLDVESVAADLRPLLAERRPENLLVISQFFERDADLNAAMNSVDAVLLDGTDYPVHSGIVSRGLAFGKCILTPACDSWTADVVRTCDAGIAYADPAADLADEWRRWRERGGPERSRNAAADLMGPKAIAQAFDTLTHRLVTHFA